MSEQGADESRARLDDMTARLLAVERRAKTLAELNLLMAQGRDPQSLAQRAVDLVRRATGASGTYVYTWDAESERLIMNVATSGRVASYLGKIKLRLGEGINGWAALMRQTAVIDDEIAQDPRYVSLPGIDESEFRSMVAAPIGVPGGTIHGVFSLYSEQPNTFDSNAVELATEVGRLLANGLVQAETLADLRRESAAARFLLDLPSQSTVSVQRCVDELAIATRRQLEADICVVEAVDRASPSAERLRPGIAFAEHIDPDTVHQAVSITSRGEFADMVESVTRGREKISHAFGMTGPEGVVTCYREQRFSDSDRGVVEALGAQAAAVLATVRNEPWSAPLAGRIAACDSSGGQVVQMLRDIGWDGRPVHPILVRLGTAESGSRRSFSALIQALQDLAVPADGGLAVPSAPSVTMLVPHGREAWSGFDQRLRSAFRRLRLSARGEVAAGIGPLISDVEAMPHGLAAAQQALSWAELLDGSGTVLHYADVAHLDRMPRVALDYGAELREAVARFQEVVQYDHRHGAELTATLDCYIAMRYSVGEAAQALFIHRNTLRQRLSRIETVIGKRLEDFEDWGTVCLAARMARLDSTGASAR